MAIDTQRVRISMVSWMKHIPMLKFYDCALSEESSAKMLLRQLSTQCSTQSETYLQTSTTRQMLCILEHFEHFC